MVNSLRHKIGDYTVTPSRSEYDDKGKRDLISTSWSGFVILLMALINIILYYHLLHGLPTPLAEDDIVDGTDLFITERAKSDLIGLVKIGVRVAGSYENEVLAVEYLSQHLEQIQAQATNDKSVQIDFARGSGSYYLTGTRGMTKVYANVGNIIARLSHGNSSNVALLVNCHYDSHPSSPGAGDNGINCAVMLEVLRVLSQSQTSLLHDIIFLFNGAEENSLEASHAFVTTHPWAADVRTVLNYDAAGYGGREALFQAGPGDLWLNTYYSSVPHPHATAVMTDMFESSINPSNTDFRIFRDYGNLRGLDMAFYMGGQVYHTLYDDYKIIPDGSYQNIGDNMLALVKALGNAPEMLESPVDGDSVYYDFLGLFLIHYSTTISIILNIATSLLAIAVAFWPTAESNYKETLLRLGKSLIFQLLGVSLGFGLSVFVGMLLDWTDNAMSWYSRPLLILGLFVVPTMVPMLGVNWALTARSIERLVLNRLGTAQRAQLHTQSLGILWAIALIALTIYGLRSAYVVAIIVGFVAASNVIISTFKLQRMVRVWLAIYISVGLFLPTIYIFWLGSTLTSFTTTLGRIGSNITPDLYLAVIISFITSTIGSFWAPIIGVVRRPLILIFGLLTVTVLTILGATVTPYGFPYTADLTSPKPQRFWLVHTERTMYDIDGNVTFNDGGFWIQNLDRNGPRTVRNYISEYDNATIVGDTCIDAIYCGMPLWKTRDMGMLNASYWIPSEKPTFQQNKPSTLSGTWTNTSLESSRLVINLTGPDHMTLFLAPRDGVTLANWSILDEVPTPITWNGRSVYYVVHNYAVEPEITPEIWLDLVIPDGVSPAIDVTLNAHYVHNTTITSVPYTSILEELPLWAAALHWTSTYKSYIF